MSGPVIRGNADARLDIVTEPVAAVTRSRLAALDALRGVAALAVVFWHWQHFFYHGTRRGALEISRQPFYDVFYLFYQKGWMAVDLFFVLSGFIFFWLYSSQIADRRIGAYDFA